MICGDRLTIADYQALGETEPGFTELVEGRVVTSPSPGICHNLAAYSLATQLDPQLPPELSLVPATDVDLRLTADDRPGFSRRPDLMIFDKAAITRVDTDDAMIRAGEVLLVVEVVIPDSHRTDYRVKHDEYADAGIPHYWIVDITEPVSLVACRGYDDAPAVTGTFTTDVPFPAKIDLNALRD